MKKDNKFTSELRFDIASKDWVIIAPSRRKKPRRQKEKKDKDKKEDVLFSKNCPFCVLDNQEKPTLIMNKGEEVLNLSKWTLVVIPNKYPAVFPSVKLNEKKEGKVYQKMSAVGFHEVVVTKDHNRHIADFKTEEVKELFTAYKKRYFSLMKEKYVNHISIFHNYGELAGASIIHPHSQIITTPLVDVDILGALSNSKKYFKKTGNCVYCQMIKWEKKEKKRIVFENDDFIAVCPFASKHSYQVIISPKKHSPYFEKTSEKEIENLAKAFSVVMKKIKKGLNNPDYNFYIHNAPCDKKNHDYYHYHFTILPRSSFYAGFEMGTRMEIVATEPEEAAKYLRKQ